MTQEQWEHCRKMLEWVKEQILKEPEHYNQEWWDSTVGECNTSYCIGGWLAHHPSAPSEEEMPDAEHRALVVLGVDDTGWLFNATLKQEGYDPLDVPCTKPGTMEHAIAGCAHIDLWLKENKPECSTALSLKAH